MAKSKTASKTVKKQQDAPKTFSKGKSAMAASAVTKAAGLPRKKLDEMQAEKGTARKMAGPKTKISVVRGAMAAAKEKENNVPPTDPQ